MDNKNLKDTYNKIAKDWHEDHKGDSWWVEGTDKFISFLKKGDLVLDVGCGSGTKSKYLNSKGLKVLGIDFSDNLIEIARKEVPNAEFMVMDIKDADKLEAFFDGIFMQAILLHIPKKEVISILKKILQKLKPGGYLYIAVKGKREGGADEEVLKENDYGYEYERFFSYFTPEELKEYFKDLEIKMVYEDMFPPSRATRATNWLQVIGQK